MGLRLNKLKYALVRTPIERPLLRFREALGALHRWRHPELREIHLEEGRIHAAIDRIVRPDSNCLDVGCHYGSMLSRFCRLAPHGRHMAFEPIPEKADFLRRKFPEVDVHELALANRAGRVTFYVNQAFTGFSGLARHGNGTFEQIEVPCAPLDQVVVRSRRFDFLKLDVEGAELYVLQGATRFLARDKPIILFECGPSGPPAFGYAAGEIHELLANQSGYSIFFLKDFLAGGRPVDRATFEDALVYPFKAFNWIAVHTEAKDPVSRTRSQGVL